MSRPSRSSTSVEADKLEEQQFVGADEDDQPVEYGITAEDRARMLELIREARDRFGLRTFRRAAGVSDNTITAVLRMPERATDAVLMNLVGAADELAAKAADRDEQERRLLAWARAEARRAGVPELARRLDFDPANLRHVLNGKRAPPRALLARVKMFRWRSQSGQHHAFG